MPSNICPQTYEKVEMDTIPLYAKGFTVTFQSEHTQNGNRNATENFDKINKKLKRIDRP